MVDRGILLARISHQLPAAADDAPPPAAFSRLGVLEVLASTPPRPSGRKHHWARHLAALVTEPGEIWGLASPADLSFFDPLHVRAELAKPVVEGFVAPLDLADVVDHALALGTESGDDKGHAGADVGAGEVLAMEL